MKAVSGPMPISMKNQGFYDQHSQTQLAIINMSLPYVTQAVSAIPLPEEDTPFTIVDYGCSEGKNSVYLIDTVIKIVRNRTGSQLFTVVFNDLWQNNFNKLFENIYQSKFRQNFVSAFAGNREQPAVHVFASGQSFHSQVMPAQTVHFGYSSSAAHWLTELPQAAIRSHIYLAGATEEEKNKLGQIAAKDWHNFLDSRAKEMNTGGRLVITMAARLTGNANKDIIKISDKHKSLFSHRTGPKEIYTAQIIMDLINGIIHEFLEEKKISQPQAEAVCFPVYPRDFDEVVAPIIETELKQKFLLEEAGIIQIPCPLFEQYLQNGDSEKYAHLLTEVFRAFMETFLLHQLYDINERQRPMRSELLEKKIIDELFNRMQSRIQAQPEYYTFFPIHSLLVLSKI